MALGALVQYGKTTTPLSGGKFISQFVDMYTHGIGEWTLLPIIFVAFACIYGTTIVAVDGYSHCNMQAVDLLLKNLLIMTKRNCDIGSLEHVFCPLY